MKYFYYTELVKHDSALKCKEFISISMLMKELKNKVLDVSLLKRMSYDFDWDYQQVLVSQVSINRFDNLEFLITIYSKFTVN